MKRIVLALTFLFTCLSFSVGKCQDKFGKVSMADMRLQECPFEKSAYAMNLIKIEDIQYEQVASDDSGKITTDVRRRIKIFDAKGFKKGGISIPYINISGSTTIDDIEAIIYNLDDKGKIITQRLGKDAIFNDKGNADTSLNRLSFAFANIKDGSIIEYRYTKADRHLLFVEPKLLQDNIPTLYYSLNVTVPDDFVRMDFHMVTNLLPSKDYSVKTYYTPPNNLETRAFTFHEIPSFKPEPLMTSVIDNLQRIDVSLANVRSALRGTPDQKWRFYNYRLLESRFFGRQFNQRLPDLMPFIDSLKTTGDTLQKLKAIYAFVKHNIQWNGEQTFFSAGLDSCWQNKAGSSAQINLLLLNLLRKAGVPCYPLLVSTRNHGMPDRTFPNLGQFNGVDILAIAGNMAYVLDCTQRGLSFKTPPYNVLYRYSYLIDPSIDRWINITASDALVNEEAAVTASINDAGILTGTSRVIFSGLAKQAELERPKDDKQAAEDKAMIQERAPAFKVDSVATDQADDGTDTLVERIKFHYTLANTGDVYFLNPLSLSFFRKKLFTDSLRRTSIDFVCNQAYTESLNVTLPANFAADDLPADKSVVTFDSTIQFSKTYYKDAAGLHAKVSFRLNKPLFLKEEYPDLKTFFDKMYTLLNDEILIKRK